MDLSRPASGAKPWYLTGARGAIVLANSAFNHSFMIMTEVYPAHYHYPGTDHSAGNFGPASNTNNQPMSSGQNDEMDMLKSTNPDKKTRFATGPATSPGQQQQQQQNQNNMVAMAAMLGQMQQQQQQQQQAGQSAGFNQLMNQAGINGVGINTRSSSWRQWLWSTFKAVTVPCPPPRLVHLVQVSPNGMAQVSGGSTAQTGRTVYVGNLPADAAVDELLSQVRFGPIDTVKVLPEKNCAFISFLDPTTAAAFHSDALMRKIQLHGQELKIGWGKPSAVPINVVMAVQQNGATRNVYLGNLEETVTEQSLRDDLSRYGPIDQVKIVRDKNIGFVHFLSIATAIKVVQTLATEPAGLAEEFIMAKIDVHTCQEPTSTAATQHGRKLLWLRLPLATLALATTLAGISMDPSQVQPGNRNVYLGNIHPETTLEEICNTIRVGILQQIRYIQDKHIAFVTFVDSNAAVAFYHTATFQGIAMHNRRLKLDGVNTRDLHRLVLPWLFKPVARVTFTLVQIDDMETFDEAANPTRFSQYGEIELVNLLKEKNCALSTSHQHRELDQAIEGIKQNEEYSKFKRQRRASKSPAQMTGFSQSMMGNPSSGFHSAGFNPTQDQKDFSNIVVTAEGGSTHASPEMPPPEA
ncbi:hypothetical protein PGTUg99_033641 [Puccinia graminis f. sp. tritici]|uniref:RRM domain-containing protein n=1 Tax=Puccinia graminis f. sp. tritici TaxID=56615 RepID=A0A5B0S1N5_PUCGR|nr:hypothetical protein PGTUg99_033641 [Puccinia graminis f. sp. tritici]